MTGFPFAISSACFAALLGACLVAVPAQAQDGTIRPAAASAAPKLDLWAIDIDGDSLLGEVELYRLMQPYLGPGRTLDDVDRARDVLEARYRELGYKSVAVTIPSAEKNRVMSSMCPSVSSPTMPSPSQ